MKNQKNMAKEINKTEIFEKLKNKLSKYTEKLKVTADTNGKYELYGNKKVTLANKEMDGLYFASAVIMKNHVGFYFFPIYTHPDEFKDTPEKLRKCLKGKSCFHIKKTDEDLFTEIEQILDKGFNFYKDQKLI